MKYRRFLALFIMAFATGCATNAEPECLGDISMKSCSDDKTKVLACKDNMWAVDRVCKQGTQCNIATGTCETTEQGCTENDTMCDAVSNILNKCSGGVWTIAENCAQSGKVCSVGSKQCEKSSACTDGDMQCDVAANILNKCAGGAWTLAENCAQTDKICNPDAKQCVEKPACEGDETRCSDDKMSVIQCSNNAWTTVKTCNDNEMCIDNACVETCPEGEYRCTGSEMLQVCRNNKWIDEAQCAAPQFCHAEAQECVTPTLAWCWFKHFDDTSKKAYAEILLSKGTPDMISAKVICGDLDVPALDWTVEIPAAVNPKFTDNDNTEYMSNPVTETEQILCTYRFDVAGKSYVCSTDQGDSNKGKPVELTPGKKLNALGENKNIEEDPYTLWGVNYNN